MIYSELANIMVFPDSIMEMLASTGISFVPV